jgi:phage N-6-adenine-methyltransferase
MTILRPDRLILKQDGQPLGDEIVLSVPVVRPMTGERNIDYATPDWLFQQLNAEFGFSIDACALPHNAKCPRFWSPTDDGLRRDWAGERPFWNPPYDDLSAWVRKAYNESLQGVTSVGLVPTWKKEYWFRLAVEHAQMRLVQGGRLFFAGNGEQDGRLAKLDCTVFVFGPGYQGGTVGPFLVPPWKSQSTAPRISAVRTYAASLSKPAGTLVLRTYAELVPYIVGFADGHFYFLVIVGPPGLAKSTLIRSKAPKLSCWIKGNASPFRAYCKLHQFQDAPIVFEDVDTFLGNRAGIGLLQQLTEHEDTKTVFWETDSPRLARLKIGNEYETSSRVCLITNNWARLATNLTAVEDRAIVVAFEPSSAEVHRQVVKEGWFKDKEILNFIEANLAINLMPTMRYYTKARQIKAAGLDWKIYLRTQWLTDETLVHVAGLLDDTSLPSSRGKARAFVERGLGSRSTFFKKAKMLREASTPPALAVQESTVFQNREEQ